MTNSFDTPQYKCHICPFRSQTMYGVVLHARDFHGRTVLDRVGTVHANTFLEIKSNNEHKLVATVDQNELNLTYQEALAMSREIAKMINLAPRMFKQILLAIKDFDWLEEHMGEPGHLPKGSYSLSSVNARMKQIVEDWQEQSLS